MYKLIIAYYLSVQCYRDKICSNLIKDQLCHRNIRVIHLHRLTCQVPGLVLHLSKRTLFISTLHTSLSHDVKESDPLAKAPPHYRLHLQYAFVSGQ